MGNRFFREELLAVFSDEVHEHIAEIRKILALAENLYKGHDSPEADEKHREDVLDIFRRFHALKGAARAVGKSRIEEIAHHQESALHHLRDQQSALTPALCADIKESLENIEVALAEPQSAPLPDEGEQKDMSKLQSDAGGEKNKAGTAHTYIHLPFARLQKLSSMTNDLLSGHERSELLGGLLKTRLDNILYASRLYEQGEQAASDSSILLTSSLMQIIKEWERWSVQVGRQLQGLRDEIEGLTFTPAGTILGGLDGMVRGIARELYGIENIFIKMQGMEVHVDRTIVQKLRDPIIQLLRNAVDHGCHSREKRQGVPSFFVPTISIVLQNSETDFVVSVSDNGQGPDVEKIAQLGRKKGLIPLDMIVSAETQAQILACVFEPGFSTRAAAGHISGRGIGLSVVKEVVQGLNGTVEFAPDIPTGSRVTIKVPLSQRRWNLLLVEQQNTLFALFGHEVEKVFLLNQADLYEKDKQYYIKYSAFFPNESAPYSPQGLRRDIPLIPLLFMNTGKAKFASLSKNGLNVIGVRVMGKLYGLLVERVLEFRQLLVSYSYDVLALDRSVVVGVTWPRGDRPVFVLNLEGVIQKWLRQPAQLKEYAVGKANTYWKEKIHTVMVIDDSPTTRMLEKNILTHNGYHVETAENGKRGLEKLHEMQTLPHLILVDVEMPEMNGFSFIEAIKKDERLHDIPVVFMTSREGWMLRRQGLEKGARAYLLKQQFDQDILLELIESILH